MGLPGSESDVTLILRCLYAERKGFATRLDRRLVNSDRTKFRTINFTNGWRLGYDRIVNGLLEGRIDVLHFGGKPCCDLE